MDRRTLTRDEALDTVREYKRVIRSRYHAEPKVVMYGSYAKGHANPDSDVATMMTKVRDGRSRERKRGVENAKMYEFQDMESLSEFLIAM